MSNIAITLLIDFNSICEYFEYRLLTILFDLCFNAHVNRFNLPLVFTIFL